MRGSRRRDDAPLVRGDCTMIAAAVQCDVDGISKGSHYLVLKRVGGQSYEARPAQILHPLEIMNGPASPVEMDGGAVGAAANLLDCVTPAGPFLGDKGIWTALRPVHSVVRRPRVGSGS